MNLLPLVCVLFSLRTSAAFHSLYYRAQLSNFQLTKIKQIASLVPNRRLHGTALLCKEQKINQQKSFSESSVDEDEFDKLLGEGELRSATALYRTKSDNIRVDEKRMIRIFCAIEERTKEAEENDLNNSKIMSNDEIMNLKAMDYPPVSAARIEMTEMYDILKREGKLRAYGVASQENYPAKGTKNVSPILLESITGLNINSLTPKPTNSLLFAGVALAFIEGFTSITTGIDLNLLILLTLFLLFLDQVIVNGAVFETAIRILKPKLKDKVLKHEAGHFLCAYLLGLPVEGFVLSTWAAIADPRFGGKKTTVNAGTSFFDPSLSDEINGRKPLMRTSIDRYTIVVMGGIAAEALNYGRADGGAGDEMSLITFLSNLNPKSGGATNWNIDYIKNQARWGALQAVLLLKEYSYCYDALVDALERGGDLGRCVYAIENAIQINGLPSVSHRPLGYIVDQGLYGEWVTTAPNLTKSEEETKDLQKIQSENEIVSLSKLKKEVKRNLNDIESQLDRLDN